MRTVNRTEFVEHIARLARRQTDEPATMLLATESYEVRDGTARGRSSISFFIDRASGVPTLNDSARGMRMTHMTPELRPDLWEQLLRILDEEEGLGEVEYIIGLHQDKIAMWKQLDEPDPNS